MTTATTVAEPEGRHHLISPRWTQCLAVSTSSRDAVPRQITEAEETWRRHCGWSLRLAGQCVGRLNTPEGSCRPDAPHRDIDNIRRADAGC
jgi:hypothetical protein